MVFTTVDGNVEVGCEHCGLLRAQEDKGKVWALERDSKRLCGVGHKKAILGERGTQLQKRSCENVVVSWRRLTWRGRGERWCRPGGDLKINLVEIKVIERVSSISFSQGQKPLRLFLMVSSIPSFRYLTSGVVPLSNYSPVPVPGPGSTID